VTVPASFSPTVGNSYVIVVSAGYSGKFGTINGLTPPNSKVLTPAYNARSLTLTVGTGGGASGGPALVVKVGGSSNEGGGSPSARNAGSSSASVATPAPPAIIELYETFAGCSVSTPSFSSVASNRSQGTSLLGRSAVSVSRPRSRMYMVSS